MIIKFYELKKNFNKSNNYYLLYGNNKGLINETIDNILKPNFSQNVFPQFVFWVNFVAKRTEGGGTRPSVVHASSRRRCVPRSRLCVVALCPSV